MFHMVRHCSEWLSWLIAVANESNHQLWYPSVVSPAVGCKLQGTSEQCAQNVFRTREGHEKKQGAFNGQINDFGDLITNDCQALMGSQDFNFSPKSPSYKLGRSGSIMPVCVDSLSECITLQELFLFLRASIFCNCIPVCVCVDLSVNHGTAQPPKNNKTAGNMMDI